MSFPLGFFGTTALPWILLFLACCLLAAIAVWRMICWREPTRNIRWMLAAFPLAVALGGMCLGTGAGTLDGVLPAEWGGLLFAACLWAPWQLVVVLDLYRMQKERDRQPGVHAMLAVGLTGAYLVVLRLLLPSSAENVLTWVPLMTTPAWVMWLTCAIGAAAPLAFPCPSCSRTVTFSWEIEGKAVSCPYCQKYMVVEDQESREAIAKAWDEITGAERPAPPAASEDGP